MTASTGGGNISVRDLSGAVSVSTGGGDVTATDLPGPVTLSSGGGNVTVSQLTEDPQANTPTAATSPAPRSPSADVRAATGGGNITLTLTRAPRTWTSAPAAAT